MNVDCDIKTEYKVNRNISSRRIEKREKDFVELKIEREREKSNLVLAKRKRKASIK